MLPGPPAGREGGGTRSVLVESDRLLIRRLEEGDSRDLERVYCDPVMMAYLGGVWTPPKVAEALREWRREWGTNDRWHGLLLRRDTGAPIGTAGFTQNMIPGEPGLELSWFVLAEYQRQGFATEITIELLRRAFDGFGAKRVLAETHPDNPAANGLLARLRFECLGKRRSRYECLPGFETQALWEMTREDWRRGAP